jgi:hypothetical protein
MPGRRPAAYLWSQAEYTEGLTGHLVGPLNGGTMAIDQDKLTEFLHKFVGDLGATMAAGNVLVGDRLGLYQVLAGQPMLPRELAERTGTAARYVDEWLRGQAAGGYVEYDPQTRTYSLTPEQAFALTGPDGAVFAPGAFELALGALRSQHKVTEAFRTGAGVGWHEHHEEVFSGCERFFRPGYAANLVASWLPALDAVEAKLNAGAKVADVGCGHGASTTLMARAFPDSTFTGSDGTWMVVEPYAGHNVTDNLNPVGRVYYSFSAFLCVPNALSQDGGYSLGAQAGEEPIRRLAADAGYTG